MESAAYCMDAMRRVRHGAYAHFPGTGPRGRHCSDCAYFDGRCDKYTEMMQVEKRENQPAISGGARACRYFVQRQEK